MRIVVGYLHRHSNPPLLRERFLESYARYPAGVNHELVIINKGGGPDHWNGLQTFQCSDSGYDIHAYWRLAAAQPADAYVFLNSYSRILAKNWCLNLTAPLVKHGLTGATGSWEKLHPEQSFPNPHIRTTGFALHGSLIPGIRWPMGLEKAACNEFEAGNWSLTRQVMAMGLKPLVMDKEEDGSPAEYFNNRRVFRVGEQEDLLIADNRTDHYAGAGPEERAYLRQLAWGEA